MIKGYRLKELRKNRGITQQELANVLGVTKATICCYEKETRLPSFNNLIDLSNYFDVTIDYLAGKDTIAKIKRNKTGIEYMTKEEIEFITKLRRNKKLYNSVIKDSDNVIKRISDLL